MPPCSALSEGKIHSHMRKRSVSRNMCPRGYFIGCPVDLEVKSTETSNDIRTPRVYVKPGVSICNFVSCECHQGLWFVKMEIVRLSLTLGFIVNKSSVFAVDNRLSMSAIVTGGVGPESRSTEVAAVV